MPLLIPIILCVLYAGCNVVGAAMIKSELAGRQLQSFQDVVSLLLTPKVICGFAIVFVSAVILIKALSMARFSFVIPISTGVNFMLTVLIGVFFFGDKVGTTQAAGLLLILGGILVLGLVSKQG